MLTINVLRFIFTEFADGELSVGSLSSTIASWKILHWA